MFLTTNTLSLYCIYFFLRIYIYFISYRGLSFIQYYKSLLTRTQQYHVPEAVQALVKGTNCFWCIMIDSAQTSTLIHPAYQLKDAKMNVKRSLSGEVMLYEFKTRHNVAETTKNICCAKGGGAADHNTVNQMVQEISPSLQGPRRSGKVR